MNNNWLFLLFSFWGDLLVSASFIMADKSSRNEPAENSETRGNGEKESEERRKEGIYLAGLTPPPGQACPC